LISCSSQSERRDEYYRLAQITSQYTVKHPLAGTLLITRPNIRGFSQERNLTFKDQPNPMIAQHYRYYLWEYDLATMLQDNLFYTFEQTKIADIIIKPNIRVIEDYTLNSTVFQLEHHRQSQPKTQTRINMEFSLIDNRCHQTLLLKSYQVSMPVEQAGITHLLSSYQKNLSQIIDLFIQDLNVVLINPNTVACQTQVSYMQPSVMNVRL
jgi:ABC-type uncharacterized transport system auxiliary subunit